MNDRNGRPPGSSDKTGETVKHYLTIIFCKLAVRNRAEAVRHFLAG